MYWGIMQSLVTFLFAILYKDFQIELHLQPYLALNKSRLYNSTAHLDIAASFSRKPLIAG